MKNLLKQIGSAISAERMKIPECNRRKFDAEAEDLFREIRKTLKLQNLNRVKKLLDGWSRRLAFLSEISDCFLAPPRLLRKEGESVKEYCERCYSKGGF